MDLRFYKEIAERYHKEFKLFKDSLFPIIMKWKAGESYTMQKATQAVGLFEE